MVTKSGQGGGGVDQAGSPTFKAGSYRWSFNGRAVIMGILNVTPDSFSDGGRFLDPQQAVDQAERMVEEGVDIIDVGGESTRPGAEPIEADQEIRRLTPVLRALAKRVAIPLSVDTRKAVVAQQALDLGAVIVNDISALRGDSQMAHVVAENQAGLVLMHMLGEPATMQHSPTYSQDVVETIKEFFEERLITASRMGIAPEHIVLDPGIGFGKDVSHNLAILRRLHEFSGLDRPLMVGVSRKSFIGRILDRPVEERTMGTAAAVAVAVWQGAQMIRVHEVGRMREVAKVVQAIKHPMAEC